MSGDQDTVKNDGTVMDGDAVGKAVHNVDQLRHAIDRGQTGEKVDYPDPAAPPLGTDDEAAGFPPAQRHVEVAARHELKSPAKLNSSVPLRGAAIVIVALALGSVLAFALKTRA